MAANPTLGPAHSGALSVPKWQLWTGRALSALPVLALVMSASMKLSQKPAVLEMFNGKLGYPAGLLTALALVELTCTVLYVVPRTAVLGAILLTGYLGGAIATHVRVADPFAVPLLLGVAVWAGLFLRDDRLRALLPLRRPAGAK
jgi:uncharacterized membrane protein YphA (DoxX/SURF4 family)